MYIIFLAGQGQGQGQDQGQDHLLLQRAALPPFLVLALTLTLVLVLTLALAPSGVINKKGYTERFSDFILDRLPSFFWLLGNPLGSIGTAPLGPSGFETQLAPHRTVAHRAKTYHKK